MRQADLGPGGGGGDARRQLSQIVIGCAAGLVVQVVEFADAGISGLLHFQKHQRGNRLDLLRRQRSGKTIHQVAPCPEAVFAGHAEFGHAGHRALKAVAVQVGQRGQQCIHDRIARLWGCPGVDAGQTPCFMGQADIVGPSRRQKCTLCKDHIFGPSRLCIDISHIKSYKKREIDIAGDSQ